MEKVLVYLSIIYKGNWQKIYNAIVTKEKINDTNFDIVLKKLEDKYITLLSPDYPTNLKNTFKPPFVLFYKGNIDLLNSKKKIAVIGSRNNSSYGKQVTESITKDLVSSDITIVSGLAKGIDSIAHKTCLNNCGNTIAVLGNGLDIVYPKENALLYEEIANKGLIISEYPFSTQPDSQNFLDRNRIIAGISDGVLVTEAKKRSGTMNTVHHALENGNQIFCVPDRANNNSGCNYLIAEGAKLVENANQILCEYE